MQNLATPLKRIGALLAAAALACCLAVCALAAAPSEAQAVTKPGTPKISSVSPYTTTQLKVKVGKVTGASGYTVLYSPYKSFKGYKSVSSTSTTITVKGLSANKTYYVKVRAYKKSSGKTYTGSWSAAKTGKTYQYYISYKLNGGKWASGVTPRYGFYKASATFSLKSPTRSCYTFGGWYTSSKFSGSKVTSIKKGTAKSKTLYAKWTPRTYTITYKLDGGTQATGQKASYNVTTATFSLKSPTKAGYDFLGWYDANGKKVTSIAKGSYGNKTLTARWAKSANDEADFDFEIMDDTYGYGAYATYIGTSTDVIVPKTLGGTEIVYLLCADSELTSLDVSKCTGLKYLDCTNNQLTALNVSKNTALVYLGGAENQLASLDVTANTALITLNCDGNRLTALDVSKNTALDHIYCSGNQLKSLDVSTCTALYYLGCAENQLNALDVSKNTALEILYCDNNLLTSLDVTANTALTKLVCANNQLTSLDASKNTALEYLDCSGGGILAKLNVNGCTAMHTLSCYYNELTALNLSTCTNLRKVYCGYNDLSEFNGTGLANLAELEVDEGVNCINVVSTCSILRIS